MIANKIKKGNTIGVVAPSNSIDDERKILLEEFKEYMEKEKGFKVIYGKNIFKTDKFGGSAGTPSERAEDINKMFEDKEIDIIWCFTGGDTANQVLEHLDFNTIRNNPKIIMGMSDVDVLLLAINKITGLVTFNSCDAKKGRGLEMDLEYNNEWFNKRLFSGEKEIRKDSEWKCLKEGKATGRLFGCNLSSILKLAGTKFFPDFSNAILFLEGYTTDTKTMQYKLEQLRQIGVFDSIKGMVIGYMYSFQDPEKSKEIGNKANVEEIVIEATKNYNFPILKINEFGHRCKNAFLPIGVSVELDASNQKLEIKEDFLK